jgi:hypothetical protein
MIAIPPAVSTLPRYSVDSAVDGIGASTDVNSVSIRSRSARKSAHPVGSISSCYLVLDAPALDRCASVMTSRAAAWFVVTGDRRHHAGPLRASRDRRTP